MSSDPDAHEDFDALIDLLAADDSINAPNHAYAESIGGLRDDNGHLDFAKVRSFFVQRGANDHGDVRGDGNTRPSPDVSVSDPSTSSALSDKDPSSNDHDTRKLRPARHEQIGGIERRPDATDLERALDSANEEVLGLRTQYHGLKSKISELFGPVFPDENFRGFERQDLLGDTGKNCSQTDPGRSIEPRSEAYFQAEVQSLTGDQVKKMLADMMRKLSLSSYGSDQLQDVQVSGHSRNQPRCLADIQRALDFVAQTDELVWKRSRFAAISGGPAAPVFSESNIADLSQRLELWESIVRNPSPGRIG